MQWEELTEPRFREALRETEVCILPIGVVERHGDHLPLGTDFLNAHRIACLAAGKEAAVVFPPFYFGQIYEARCFAGTVTLPPDLLLKLIRSVLDEIGRNGFKKIIIYNGHGGNRHLLPFIAQCSLSKEKSYTLYLYQGLRDAEKEKWNEILDTTEHGHACECETSVTLANFENLVDRNALSEEPGTALGRLAELTGAYSGIGWYADYPRHYAGDARSATKEKGLRLRQIKVDSFAAFIGRVREDTVTPSLEREFFSKESELSPNERELRG